MSSFKTEYDSYDDENENDVVIVGTQTGKDAIESLNKADQHEVYRFDCYSQGIFNYLSEDSKRLIALGFTGHNITLPCFVTVPDMLLMRGRDYIEIRLFE